MLFSAANLARFACGYPICLVPAVLALHLVQGLPAGRHRVHRVAAASLLLAAALWTSFRLVVGIYFPRVEFAIPWVSTLECWAILTFGTTASIGVTGFARRSVRNAVFAGSLLCSALSCTAFAAMGAFASPLVLAYNLTTVLLAMASASVLAACALWLLGRPAAGAARLLPAALIAFAMLALALASLGSILPFSEWEVVRGDPAALEFRPVNIVFLSELAVTGGLVLAGAGVDHQAAAQTARENLRLRQLTDSTFEALLVHRDGLILDANTAFCELTGLPLAAVLGQTIDRFLPGSSSHGEPAEASGKPNRYETEIADANGEKLPVEYLSREISYIGGAARVTALRDIRERRAAEQRVRFLAEHDALTGLPNRAKFRDIITRRLAALRRADSTLAVFFIDLDRFKSVNDTLGHQAGDMLLRQVAERIQRNIRATDVVARIGGDEFLLLGEVIQPDWSATLAERLIEELGWPFDLDGKQACIGASIGIAIAPQDGTDADELINHADLALYQCKANGRGQFSFFKPEVQTAALCRRDMQQAMARALTGNGFTLALQPFFGGPEADDLRGFEALLRWPQPDGRLISPADFIPIAEESGLIAPLGAWVLRAACREAASWQLPCLVAVNVSPRQLVKGDFVALVAEVLRETGLSGSRLEIEITETVLVKDADAALDVLRRLKQLGVHVALDDFGTGYSSLSYLQRFPFDKVKIDRSFVQPLETSAGARAIIRAILAMCQQLQIEVIAEGVETEGQLHRLRSSGCELFQGFMLGRPMSSEEVAAFLAARIEASAFFSEEKNQKTFISGARG